MPRPHINGDAKAEFWHWRTFTQILIIVGALVTWFVGAQGWVESRFASKQELGAARELMAQQLMVATQERAAATVERQKIDQRLGTMDTKLTRVMVRLGVEP